MKDIEVLKIYQECHEVCSFNNLNLSIVDELFQVTKLGKMIFASVSVSRLHSFLQGYEHGRR